MVWTSVEMTLIVMDTADFVSESRCIALNLNVVPRLERSFNREAMRRRAG